MHNGLRKNLKESGQFTHEWQWHERRIETAITDGGKDEVRSNDGWSTSETAERQEEER